MYSEVTLNEHLNDFRGGLFNVKYKLYRFLGSLCFLRDFLVSFIVTMVTIICCTTVATITVSWFTMERFNIILVSLYTRA